MHLYSTWSDTECVGLAEAYHVLWPNWGRQFSTFLCKKKRGLINRRQRSNCYQHNHYSFTKIKPLLFDQHFFFFLWFKKTCVFSSQIQNICSSRSDATDVSVGKMPKYLKEKNPKNYRMIKENQDFFFLFLTYIKQAILNILCTAKYLITG